MYSNIPQTINAKTIEFLKVGIAKKIFGIQYSYTSISIRRKTAAEKNHDFILKLAAWPALLKIKLK